LAACEPLALQATILAAAEVTAAEPGMVLTATATGTAEIRSEAAYVR
jgi:hypothetical protein